MTNTAEDKQEWVKHNLNLWGAWAFSGLDFENRINMIAKLMQSADPNKVQLPVREMCGDELGLLISSVISYYVKNPCPQDYKYLEAKYVYGCSIYAIAKYEWTRNKSKTLRTWQRNIKERIEASEWVIGKFLDLAIKNHKRTEKI